MLSLVECGRLGEWEGSAATDWDVARYAKMLESTGLTPEVAKQKAESSRSSLSACPQVSYLQRDGKYYLMPPAEDLPESVAYYDKVKALTLDRMQLLIASVNCGRRCRRAGRP